MNLELVSKRLVRRAPVVPTATLFVLAFDQASAILFAVAVFSHVITMPATGRLLLMLLGAGAPPPKPNAPPELIVVPTAGAYRDDGGQWWPSTNTFNRMAHALTEKRRLGLPLMVVGRGADVDPGEAAVAALHFEVRDSDGVIVLAEGDTTDASAEAVARGAAEQGMKRVLLITHSAHVARMAACLRRRGLIVAGVRPAPNWRMWARPRYLLPDTSGSILLQRSMYEILAIAAYLWRGYFRIRDLLPKDRPVPKALGDGRPVALKQDR